MVYRLLLNDSLKFLAAFSHIDPERPEVIGRVEFLHPDKVHWRATLRSNPMTSGYAVDSNTVPRMLRRCDDHMALKPVVDKHNNTLLVSKRVRNVIKRFEPGVHQFLPQRST